MTPQLLTPLILELSLTRSPSARRQPLRRREGTCERLAMSTIRKDSSSGLSPEGSWELRALALLCISSERVLRYPFKMSYLKDTLAARIKLVATPITAGSGHQPLFRPPVPCPLWL